MIIKIFKYIEPIWLGTNNKLSIRRVLSLVFSINLVWNITKTLSNPLMTSSYADVAMLLGIEAGLIAASGVNFLKILPNIAPGTQILDFYFWGKI